MIVPYRHVLLLSGLLFTLGMFCTVTRRNLIRAEQMPYRTASGGRYDGGDYAAAVEGYRAALALGLDHAARMVGPGCKAARDQLPVFTTHGERRDGDDTGRRLATSRGGSGAGAARRAARTTGRHAHLLLPDGTGARPRHRPVRPAVDH